MSYEQIEGQLGEFEGKMVSVCVPIRGTISQTYFGKLTITHDWENHSIYYSINYFPDMMVSFQSHDVHKIVPTPNPELHAGIFLKSDAPMEQHDYIKL